MKKIYYIIILLVGFSFSPSFGQNQCTNALNNARILYTEGHFYQIPAVLEECLNRGFTREQRIQAYHMLTMVYLYLDEHEKAEQNYLKLLQLDPEFDVENDNDNIEIVYLDQKYKTTPIFTLTARGGANMSAPIVIHDYDSDPEAYEYRPGYWFGPGIELSINNHFKVGAELLYRRTAFHYTSKRFFDEDLHDVLNVTLVQNWISLPVLFKYTYRTNGLQPYVFGGVTYDYLINSSGTLEFENVTEDQGSFSIRTRGLDYTPLRNRVLMNLMGGIGVRKRIGYQYIFVEFRFIGGLKNLVDADNRYLLQDNYLYDFEGIFDYTYIDDDMRLNSFNVSLGYELPFYKPRRIITHRSGFLRRIFN